MTDVQSLALRVSSARQRLDRQAGEAAQLARQGLAVQADVARLTGQLELHSRVGAVLTSIGEARQETAQTQVEDLVTRALQAVFDANLSFHLVQEVKANRAEVSFALRSQYGDQVIDTPVLEARGGGMAAVVAFVLRLVVLLLTPGTRRFLALDETFAHVSASYEPRVAEFLREVADKAGVQILLVTHSQAYSDLADRKHRLVLGPAGITQVHEGESE